MGLNVLSGDSLLAPFRRSGVEGEIAVFRECLVDGPLAAPDPEAFFLQRSRYLSSDDDGGFYEAAVRPEIEKILNHKEGEEIFLWFEHELFCQVNLWFILSNLVDRSDLWIVSPPSAPDDDRFAGWAHLGPDELRDSFENRSRVSEADRRLGYELWQAFSERDTGRLRELGGRKSTAFRFLPEVTLAASEIDSRPEARLRAIADQGIEDFGDVFRAFSKMEPVYGFGDLQVKRIWEKISASP